MLRIIVSVTTEELMLIKLPLKCALVMKITSTRMAYCAAVNILLKKEKKRSVLAVGILAFKSREPVWRNTSA
jgi:hypothetical protein